MIDFIFVSIGIGLILFIIWFACTTLLMLVGAGPDVAKMSCGNQCIVIERSTFTVYK